ncbi:MAG: glycosyltransferase [bacterium]|nr:glycosyltransferase [bacterium]MDZ4231971.1 glycosyltransferase [Candidatus Pacearchaeota archaeon]
MKFSFIIPAYNEEKRIETCLASIMQLPDIAEHEVLVVDNNSQDATAQIVRTKFPEVKLITETEQGMCIARNKGASEATGDILVFFDADCVIPEWWTERVTRKFEDDPGLLAVSGPYHFFDLPWYYKWVEFVDFYVLYVFVEYILNRLFHKSGLMVGGNLAVRRDAFFTIGGFDTSILFYGEDMDIAERLMKLGRVRYHIGLWVGSSARRLLAGNPLKQGFWYLFSYVWYLTVGESRGKRYEEVR